MQRHKDVLVAPKYLNAGIVWSKTQLGAEKKWNLV
jgi:hypothetical protein